MIIIIIIIIWSRFKLRFKDNIVLKIGEKRTNQMERRIDENKKICLLLEMQSLFHLFDKAMDINFEEKKF